MPCTFGDYHRTQIRLLCYLSKRVGPRQKHPLEIRKTPREANRSTGFNVTELEKRQQPQLPRSSEELEDLQKLLHFPEEVALRLTETEHQLFYKVPPDEYLRHVAQDLAVSLQRQQHSKSETGDPNQGDGPSLTSSSTQTADAANWPTSTASVTVQTLIDRFTEVRCNKYLPGVHARHRFRPSRAPSR